MGIKAHIQAIVAKAQLRSESRSHEGVHGSSKGDIGSHIVYWDVVNSDWRPYNMALQSFIHYSLAPIIREVIEEHIKEVQP